MTNFLRFILFYISLFISYFYILDNHFLGDDISRLVKTIDLRTPLHALTGGLADRPLLVLLMWLEKTIFGLNPISFRLINLLGHSFVALQIYLIIRDLASYRGRTFDKEPALWATVVALIFALHPLHGQSIYIVIQGGVIFAALFGLISLRYFFKWIYIGDKTALQICFSALFVGMLFKPIVSFLPFFYFFAAYQLKGFQLRILKSLTPCFLILLVPVFYYFFLGKNSQALALSPLKYSLVQTEVLFTYLKLIFFPVNLQYLHDFIPPENVWLNLNWIYLLVHLVMISTFWVLVKDKLYRLLGIGVYFSFLPESSLFPILHLSFEHRTYLAVCFLFLLAGLVIIDETVKLRKYFRPLSLFAIISYVILIQTRNFQVKPETNWMLHTLENSYRDHDYNFGTSIDFLQKADPELLQPVMSKYKEIYSDRLGYQILLNINRYYLEGKPKKILMEIGDQLMQGGLSGTQRLLGDNFYVGNMADLIKGQEENLMIEDVLFAQIPYFVDNLILFEGKLRFYRDLAKHILLYADGGEKHKIETSRNLRIKATLVHYFGFKYDDLASTISNELKLHPGSQDLMMAYKLVFFTKKRESVLEHE